MNIKKNLRLIVGIAVLVVGAVFMVIPFIPLGYIFLFIGAFLLADKVPFLKKFMQWLKKKDKSGKLEKAEDKVDDVFKGDSTENEEKGEPIERKDFNIYRVNEKT